MEPADTLASERHVRIAVTRDQALADRWCDVLVGAGIEAFVEIDDDRNVVTGNSRLTWVYTGPGYVHLVSVPEADRERATAILQEHGWSAPGDTSRAGYGTLLRLMLVIAGVSLSLFLLRLLSS